jgi:hypothetical protein
VGAGAEFCTTERKAGRVWLVIVADIAGENYRLVRTRSVPHFVLWLVVVREANVFYDFDDN